MFKQNNIQVVRVLFGDNPDEIFREVPAKPEFNEIVYVCGVENQKELERRGFETYLFDEKPMGISTHPFTKFINKLVALDLACQHFSKFVMLDWDANLIKPLDDQFFRRLEKSNILIPTYSYPISMLDVERDDWYHQMCPSVKQYSWKLDNYRIVPNACFIYVNNQPDFGKQLLDVAIQNSLKTNIEEFAIYIWANKDLEQFIIDHEPFCIYGRPEWNHFTYLDFSEKCEIKLHEYINKLIDKSIYFEHV